MPGKGHACPEEHRQRLRELMTGKKKSPEAVRKMALTKIGKKYFLGRKHTEESKEKNRIAHLGKKSSEETRRRQSESLKGKVPHNLGKKHTPEHIEKMRASYTGWNNGENSYNWKGGITPLTKQIRYCFKYRQWRSDVFTRDDFTCVLCGERGVYIEADHYPVSFSEIFFGNGIVTLEQALGCEEFWNINNGRTLCRECHEATKPGRPKNSERQKERG